MTPAGHAAILAIIVILATCIYREAVDDVTILFIGSYNFTVAEPVVFATFGAAAMCLVERPPHLSILTVLIGIIGAVILFDFLKGMALDAGAALVWLRNNGPVAPILVMGLTAPRSTAFLQRFRICLCAATLSLAVIVFARLLTGGSNGFSADVDVLDDSSRALSAAGAVVLSLTCIYMASDYFRHARGARAMTDLAILVVAVVALAFSRQGTAIICALAGMGLVVALETGHASRGRLIALALGLPLILIAVVVSSETKMVSSIFAANVQRRNTTLETRLNIWSGFWSTFQRRPTFERLVGEPAGLARPFDVQVGRNIVEWDHSLHSMYVGMLALAGFVGLGAYLMLIAHGWLTSLRGCFARHAGTMLVSAPLSLGLFTAAALYGYTYELRREELLMLFLALYGLPVLAARARPRVRAERHYTAVARRVGA